MNAMHALRLRGALASLVLFCSLIPVGHAAIFEDGEARRAILEMRQRVDAMQQNSLSSARSRKCASEDSSQLRRSLLDLQTQIETLRVEMAKLRGQNEQLTRDVAELQRHQKEIATGVDERLRQFEPLKVSLDGLEFQAEPAEKKDFETALAKFREGRFADAEAAYIRAAAMDLRCDSGWGMHSTRTATTRRLSETSKVCWQAHPAMPVPPKLPWRSPIARLS